MTLLQVNCSYVSNDAEISEILRMKNQKRIQNVMTGGGIIFDNSAKIEKEQKPTKTSSVLINDFDNDFINNLFAKKFTIQGKSSQQQQRPSSPSSRNCDELSASPNCESKLSASLNSNSSILGGDSFPLLSSRGARDAATSSPMCVESEEQSRAAPIFDKIETDPKSLDPTIVKDEINFSELTLSENPFSPKFHDTTPPSSIVPHSISFNCLDLSNRIDLISSSQNFPPLIRSSSFSQTSLNIFSSQDEETGDRNVESASQKLSDDSLFDNLKSDPASIHPFPNTSQSSCSVDDNDDFDSFRSNLNDLSSIQKNLADKDPFATLECNFSADRTVFNIVDAERPVESFLSPNVCSLLSSGGALFKSTAAKLKNGESTDSNEGENNNSCNNSSDDESGSDSDSNSDCESIIKSKSNDASKSNDISTSIAKSSVNNIQILSNTLKSLKLSCWYYENLSHFEAIKLLSCTQPGTFLVRNSSDSKFLFTLSIQTYRQPTSIRIQYNDGKFCLDCENSVTETIPKFNSIMELIGHYIQLTADTVHYINNNVVNENKQVLIDEYGKIFSNILLTKPMFSPNKLPSLKHLARLSLNKFEEIGYSYKIPTDELTKYMNEYPFTI